MTAPTEQFTEFATKAQEQVTAAVRTWADALQTATGSLTTERPALVDPAAAVEKYFDFAQQVLDKQREYAKAALAATAKN
jgi:ABC-type transporter Mla subunit MlaD